MRGGVVGVRVLVRLPAVRCLAGEAAGDAVFSPTTKTAGGTTALFKEDVFSNFLKQHNPTSMH